MRLTWLSVDSFKNLKQVSLRPDPSYNLILGENAQGKTNLLESIWALTGCRSFRGSHDRDYPAFDGGTLVVEARFQDSRREQSVRLCMTGGSAPEKKFWCNDVPQKGGTLFSVFHCVVFTPEDLALVSGGPERRRSFLDLCSSQLSPPFLAVVRRYQLALQQRNAVLKQNLPQKQAEAMLTVWDGQLARLGAEIAVQRAAYVRRLSEACVPLYSEIARGREKISLHYHASIYGRDAQDQLPDKVRDHLILQYAEKMQQNHAGDLFSGHTGMGVHRDDLMLCIDGRPAREFGSQGQKKSLALAMKLAQAQIYSKRRKESPIVLLDDVMGELDDARQAVVSTIVENMQVFVTTCHPESVLSPKNGRRFLLKEGCLRELEEGETIQ